MKSVAESGPPRALYSHDTVETLALARLSLRRTTKRLEAVKASSGGRYSFVAEDEGEE